MNIENEQPSAVEAAPDATQESAAPQTTDLDGLSRFSFQGQEYTPDQLSKLFNEHKSYSESQSTWKQEQEFQKFLRTDLDNVARDPSLAARFKEVYPAKYHSYLDLVLKEQRQEQAQGQQAQGLPREFLNEFGQLKHQLQSVLHENHQAKVEAAAAKIDAVLPPLLTKYPMAIEDQVLARAESLLNGGNKLTDKTWERLVRESHETFEKRANQVMSAKMKAQTEKAKQARETAPGGQAPGHAPVKPRTFAEAQDEMMKHVRSQRMG